VSTIESVHYVIEVLRGTRSGARLGFEARYRLQLTYTIFSCRSHSLHSPRRLAMIKVQSSLFKYNRESFVYGIPWLGRWSWRTCPLLLPRKGRNYAVFDEKLYWSRK